MNALEIIGYLATALVGMSLGLIGSGGSILTIPILVYLFQMPATTATSYSLVLVGFTALLGAFKKHQNHEVDWKVALFFGLPALLSVYATRRWLLMAIPEHFTLGPWPVGRDLFLLLLFSVLMVLAALSMMRKNEKPATSEGRGWSPLAKQMAVVAEGGATGVITGLVGAGGGFLIIPALVVLGKMPIKMAMGTSLAIIAAKSLVGFAGDLGNPEIHIQYGFLLALLALSGIGMLAGNALASKIAAEKLKVGFAWFVLAMAAFILAKELL